MTSLHRMPLSFIPSPPVNGFHIGPLFVHFYGLMYVIGIALAVIITQRRVRSSGGDPSVVADVALWAVPAGIIGGRIYFDLTTPADIPHVWYGAFAVWTGGLGVWGGIAGGALAGIWRLRRHGVSFAPFADAVAPALLVAQAVGRIGNYFNQELYGKPTTLPWALVISHPHGYPRNTTFQPTFLYELIWDLALAAPGSSSPSAAPPPTPQPQTAQLTLPVQLTALRMTLRVLMGSLELMLTLVLLMTAAARRM